MAAGENVKVAVAAYLTNQTRLKLYEYLSELVGVCPELWDSVIFIQNVDEPQSENRWLSGSPHRRVGVAWL
jgi:hypothetical protein